LRDGDWREEENVMALEPVLEFMCQLIVAGRSAEEIADRMGKPVGWVEEVSGDKSVKARCSVLRKRGQPMDDETELWDENRILFARDRLTPLAFKTLEALMISDKTTPATRYKCAELILNYRTELKKEKQTSDDSTTRVYIGEEEAAYIAQVMKELKGGE
jgi:hypothetical protein